MKLLFAADMVPTELSEQYYVEGDVARLFGDIPDLVKGVDRFFVNVEFALTEKRDGIKKIGPVLRADPFCADTIKKLGVTDVALANNHVYDCGEEGLRDTMHHLDRVGLPYFGVGENDTLSRKPYFFEENGKRVAVVNVCEHEYTYALPNRIGVNPFDPFLTMEDIRQAKKQADYVIVIYHGGKEHCGYPSPRLRTLCQEMVRCGANAVFCQHSHCIGCYECYEGAHIVYGQGNFHFARQNRPRTWDEGLLVQLNIGETVEVEFYPYLMDGVTVHLAKGEAYDALMQPFFARSEELKTDAWLAGWRAFCETQREYFTTRLRLLGNIDTDEMATQFLAHYLACEAHTDVMKELFQTWHKTE